jgi:hypothetical protein
MPQLELEPGVGYLEMGLGEFGEDISFPNWVDTTSCCPADLELVDPSAVLVSSGLAEEANMEFEIMDDPVIAAAAAMGWASPECLGLRSPECLGLDVDASISSHMLNIQAPFASSCELARKIAPRPEGHGGVPLRICVAGDKLDGLATLEPVEEDELDGDSHECDLENYVRKVPNDGKSLVADVRRAEVATEEDVEEPPPEASTSREEAERIFLEEAEFDPEVNRDKCSSHRTNGSVGPQATVRGMRSQNEIGPTEAMSQEAMALGAFDGFLFSEPGKMTITEPHEETWRCEVRKK